MHDNNKVTENDHSDDDNFLIIIDDDNDDANPLIAIVGSHGALGPTLDAAATRPTLAMATPMPVAPHASIQSVNIGGAPAASTAAPTIPPTFCFYGNNDHQKSSSPHCCECGHSNYLHLITR
jgi:hypothetical protein